MKGTQGEWIAAADIGNASVTVLVGRPTTYGVEIWATSTERFDGASTPDAEVLCVDRMTEALRAALNEASTFVGRDAVQELYVTTSSADARSLSSFGVSSVPSGVVEPEDVQRALSATRDPAPPPGLTTLHVMPVEFILDDHLRVRRPHGLRGQRLEARVQRVLGSQQRLQMIRQCAKNCGVSVRGVAADVVAASTAVLKEQEKEDGVVLIDIGHAATDVAVWQHGSLHHSARIPLAGHHIVSDIGVALRVDRERASRLKREHGVALTELVDQRESFFVRGPDGRREHPRRLLATIIEPRLQEIFECVRREVGQSGVAPKSVVLTGGTAMLNGACDLAAESLGAPARLGLPERVGGMMDVVRHPRYAASVGALLEAVERAQLGRSPSGFYPLVKPTRWQVLSRNARALLNRLF